MNKMANKIAITIGIVVFVLLMFTRLALIVLMLTAGFILFTVFRYLIFQARQGGSE